MFIKLKGIWKTAKHRVTALRPVRKAVALLCLIALMLELGVLLPIWELAAAGRSSASHTSEVATDSVFVTLNSELTDMGSGNFTLRFKGSSRLKDAFSPSARTVSEDGVYTADKNGFYLIELWGGDGGRGGDSAQSQGGEGGKGGYIYGYIELHAGDQLVYTIGTNGATVASVGSGQSEGGGENEGGDKDGNSAYSTGTGGGFSAIYLFEKSKGETYSGDLTRAERLNNYIMIAAGGGGGGAGNQLLMPASGRPHGGNGGNLSSVAGHLTAENNNGIAGTFFNGKNGATSGTNTSYIGHGGSNLPGSHVSTVWSLVSSSQPADDWINSNGRPEGSGGDGILRGGAGGAGFCGGSGGIQSSILLATNIGGGGGGSSFISDKVEFTSIPVRYQNYITGVNPSDVGGACYITFMGSDDVKAVDMTNVSSAVTLSKYFEVASAYVDNHNGTVTTTVNPDGTTTVNVTGANINYNPIGLRDNELSLVLSLRPKAGFAGGNNVPLYPSSDRLTITAENGLGAEEHYRVTASSSVDYANVALQFRAVGNSFSTSDNTKNFPVSDLYTDNYASVRGSLGSHWEYDFINSIGTYSVTKEGVPVTGTILGSSLNAPTEVANPTVFQVAFTVNPVTSGGFAEVGAAIYETKFTAPAAITLLKLNQIEIVGGAFGEKITLTGGKSLQFLPDKSYRFGLDASMSFSFELPQKSGVYNADSVYTVPASGWYYIEALGGAGGGAGSATMTAASGHGPFVANGIGQSTGGYTGGYIHLNKNDTVRFYTGGVGTASDAASGELARPSGGLFPTSEKTVTTQGGTGGGSTSVYINDVLAMVSGGGGGAGGAAIGASQIRVVAVQAPDTQIRNAVLGANGASNTSGTVNAGLSTATPASSGGPGTATGGSSATAGTSGSAGINIIKAPFFDAGAPDIVKTTYTDAKYKQITVEAKAGEGAIACIATDAELLAGEELAEAYSIEGKFSRYFTVTQTAGIHDIKMLSSEITDGMASTTTGPNGEGFYTRVYNNGTTDVASFMYKLVTDESGTSFVIKNVVRDVESTPGDSPNEKQCLTKFSFQINLLPTEGFYGGNNVPVLSVGGVAMNFKTATMVLAANDVTDYANVAINYTFDESLLDTKPELYINYGDEVNLNTELLLRDDITLKSGMSASESWKADYVDIVRATVPSPNHLVTPAGTTVYAFRQSVKPLYHGGAVVAEVVSPIPEEGLYIERSSVVFVSYAVTTSLTHITAIGSDRVMDGSDIDMMLISERGYDLPNTIDVQIDGVSLGAENYSYDKATGELVIPDNSITGNVHIVVVADVRFYQIHWIDQTDGDKEVYLQEFAADEPIVNDAAQVAWYSSFMTAKIPSEAGKVYTWDYTTPDGLPPTTMPASDLYFYGSFTAIPCRLTINYYEIGTTNVLAPTYSKLYAHGSGYNVLSPVISGYLADPLVVADTITEDTTVNVYYTSTAGKLNIIYIYGDSETGASETYSATIADGEHYSVSSPVITGYTPRSVISATGETVGVDLSTVSGTMTSAGAVIYVYYNPIRYTTTFVTDGGTLAAYSRPNVYKNLLGFDPAEGGFVGMPEPQLLGYDFVGWSLTPCPHGGVDSDCGCAETVFVGEEDVVTGNVTLYAHYKAHKYVFRMKFTYVDGFQYRNNGNAVKTVRPDFEVRLKAGETVDLYMPDGVNNIFVEGYTPKNQQSSAEITNSSTLTIGYTNTVIYVEYYIQSHTVTLELYGGETGSYTKFASQPVPITVEYNDAYSFTLPDYESVGYKYDEVKTPATFTYIGDMASAINSVPRLNSSGSDKLVEGLGSVDDVVIKVYYEFIYYTLTIDYMCGGQTGNHNDYGIDYEGLNQYSGKYHVGQSYNVVSPVIPNHTCSRPTVSGTYGIGDMHEDVTYSLETHTLTIHYKYADDIADPLLRGTTIKDVVMTLGYGAPYNVTSDPIMGYYYSRGSYVGNLTTDLEFTVEYSDNAVLSVTVTFGELKYDFTDYVWNPTHHIFTTENAGGEINPLVVDSNKISMTKDTGSMDLVASIGFVKSPSSAYSMLQGCLSATSEGTLTAANEVGGIVLPTGTTVDYYLRLYGGIDLSKLLDGGGHLPLTGTVGIVTVTISESP